MNALKEKIDARLHRIANFLLLNSSFIDNIGLLNGKMGIAIFFFEYARYSKYDLYDNYAGELIDEISVEVNTNSPVDFANGLMGFGWGIEYLVQNGFVEANSDEVLAEIDQSIFRSTLDAPLAITNHTELFGIGLYYLARLKGREDNNENLNTIIKKQMLTYLLDDCERLLSKKELFGAKVPILTISQLNSIIYYLIEMQRLQLFPIKIDRLEHHLIKYLIENAGTTQSNIERSSHIQLLDMFSKSINDKHLLDDYRLICESLNTETDFITINSDSIISEFIKGGWYPLLYPVSFNHNIYFIDQCKKAFSLADSEVTWNNQLDQINKNNIGLTGLAGLGLAILKMRIC